MTAKKFATGAALTIAGLLAAVGIGLLANSISGDNVGLSAQPLSASNAGTRIGVIAQRKILFFICERTGISTGQVVMSEHAARFLYGD